MPIFGARYSLLWVRVRDGAPSGAQRSTVDGGGHMVGVSTMAGRAACTARAEDRPVYLLLPSFLPRCPIDAIIALLASWLCPIQYSTSPNGCYRPHGAHGASHATQVASTLLTVSLYVRMICGEPSLQAEATVAFTRRARPIPDVIRGPYPSTRRRTRFLPHPIILKPIAGLAR